MNLLYTVTSYPPSVGGAQLYMHNLALPLSTRHHIQVVTQWDTNRTDWLLGTTLRAPSPACAYEIDGISVQRITLSEEDRLHLFPWVIAYYPLQEPALRRIANALEVQIAPWLSDADLVHNCRIGREGLSYASFQAARRRDIPFVLTPVHHPRWSGWLHRYYIRLYQQADAVIALTEAERQLLIKLGIAESRIHVTGMGPVIANASDGNRFRERYQLGDQPIVLFLGQKYAYKGLFPYLKAAPLVWKKNPHTQFVFVGPRTSFSRHLFKNIKDKRILELDNVDLSTKTDALAACSLLCVPSSQESFGGVYTEAWSFDKPVIGCNIPAVSEVITEGVDGFLVEQTPDSIAESIHKLISDPQMAFEMGRNGHKKVKERFTWPKLAQLTEEVYRAILG